MRHIFLFAITNISPDWIWKKQNEWQNLVLPEVWAFSVTFVLIYHSVILWPADPSRFLPLSFRHLLWPHQQVSVKAAPVTWPNRNDRPIILQHPLGDVSELASGNKDSRDRRLILWYFEGELKDRYDRFIKAIEVSSAFSSSDKYNFIQISQTFVIFILFVRFIAISHPFILIDMTSIYKSCLLGQVLSVASVFCSMQSAKKYVTEPAHSYTWSQITRKYYCKCSFSKVFLNCMPKLSELETVFMSCLNY